MIPESVMRELRYIEVVAKKRIRNLRAGTYTSPLRGDGFDFDEHRPYRPGDDVRRIDWNVTARFGMPFLRQTHAERELNLIVALDMSRSMALGTRASSKRAGGPGKPPRSARRPRSSPPRSSSPRSPTRSIPAS